MFVNSTNESTCSMTRGNPVNPCAMCRRMTVLEHNASLDADGTSIKCIWGRSLIRNDLTQVVYTVIAKHTDVKRAFP